LLPAPTLCAAQDLFGQSRRLEKPKVDGGLSLLTNKL
jgi:hypothetical protein